MFGSQIASTNRGDFFVRESRFVGRSFAMNIHSARSKPSDDLPLADVINRALLLGDVCAEERDV